MATLYLSVDCGGSQTKIIYQLSGQESPGYLLMSPLVEEIKPEKIVTYLDRKSSLGSPAPDREAVLMFGHRNVTALYFDRGKLSGDSPLLGFTNFLDAVMERKSVDRELLAIAVMDTIAQAHNSTHPQTESYNHYPDWGKYPPIKGLAKAKDVELKERECKLIVDAIAVATQEYWEKVEKWLGKTIPHAVDIVVISGGASEFLEPDLERYFNAAHAGRKKDHYSPWRRSGEYIAIDKDKPMPELLWGVEIIDLVREKFNIDSDKDDHNLAIRLVDCYGLFDYLVGSMEGK